MSKATVRFVCEIEVRPGESLRLPDTLIERVGAGRWLVTIKPIDSVEPRRGHGAFLAAYATEDDGLYDDVESQ